MPDTIFSSLPSAGTLATTDTALLVQNAVTVKTDAGNLIDPLHLGTDYKNTVPSTPSSGLKLFNTSRGSRSRPSWVNDQGQSRSAQSFLATNKIGIWSARGNSATLHNSATPGLTLWNFQHTGSGTATSRSADTANNLTRSRRLGFQSAATINSLAGTRHGNLQFCLKYGFEYIARFGIATSGATHSLLAGFTGSAGVQSVPGTSVNTIGFGFDNGDTVMSFYHSSSSFTKIPTTMNVSGVSGTDLYEIRIFAIPMSDTIDPGTVYWSIWNISTGAYQDGIATTNLPPATTLLSPQITYANNGTAAAVAIDIVSQYIETDY